MDYAKKINRMDEHLREHPHDYQTVISRLKVASDAYDYQEKKKVATRLRRLAEVRRQLKEIRDGKECVE
jgi:ribosomal protein S15P/S13E